MVKNCPDCQELRRRGIVDPILALERQMLVNNFLSVRLSQILGHEEMKLFVYEMDEKVKRELEASRQ